MLEKKLKQKSLTQLSMAYPLPSAVYLHLLHWRRSHTQQINHIRALLFIWCILCALEPDHRLQNLLCTTFDWYKKEQQQQQTHAHEVFICKWLNHHHLLFGFTVVHAIVQSKKNSNKNKKIRKDRNKQPKLAIKVASK